MIARNIQELADAVNVLEQRLTRGGIQQMGHSTQLFRMAEVFGADLLLASNDGQVAALIQAHPKRARAFLTILAEVREELEEVVADISAVPDVPFLLYGPAADAVCEAVRAYRSKMPYLVFLARQQASSDDSPQVFDR